jgi:hypothetical protein
MRVKALQRFPYAGKQIEIGDEFDVAQDIHARILAHGGSVTIIQEFEPYSVPPPKPVITRVLRAEDEPPKAKPMTTEDTPLVPARRTYRRRDMKAEE